MKYYKTEIIDEYLIRNQISKSRFCKLCGITNETLNRIYANDAKIRVRQIMKIIKFLQIYPTQFFTF